MGWDVFLKRVGFVVGLVNKLLVGVLKLLDVVVVVLNVGFELNRFEFCKW